MPFDGLEEAHQREALKAPTWRNLYAHPDHGRAFGPDSYPSKEAAFTAFDKAFHEPPPCWNWHDGRLSLKVETTVTQVQV